MELLAKGIWHSDKVIAMRFIEVISQISKVCEDLGERMKSNIELILDMYFIEDELVWVTLVEQIIDLCQSNWNTWFVCSLNFIEWVLQKGLDEGDVFGPVNHSFMIYVAQTYKQCPEIFDLSRNYMRYLLNNIDSKLSSDKECALSCISILLSKNKQKSLEFLLSSDDLLFLWL